MLINLLQEENKKKNDDLRIKDEDMNSVETNDDGDENSILANSSKMNSNQV